MRILMSKSSRVAGNTWKSLFADGSCSADPIVFDEMEKKMTLERFQREVGCCATAVTNCDM